MEQVCPPLHEPPALFEAIWAALGVDPPVWRVGWATQNRRPDSLGVARMVTLEVVLSARDGLETNTGGLTLHWEMLETVVPEPQRTVPSALAKQLETGNTALAEAVGGHVGLVHWWDWIFLQMLAVLLPLF